MAAKWVKCVLDIAQNCIVCALFEENIWNNQQLLLSLRQQNKLKK